MSQAVFESKKTSADQLWIEALDAAEDQETFEEDSRMAAKFRKIDPRIWTDEKFDRMTAIERLVTLHLLTSPDTNRMGICVTRASALMDACDLEMTPVEVMDLVDRVCGTFDWPVSKQGRTTLVICFTKWFRYNPPDSSKVMTGNLKDLSDVPRCEAVERHLSAAIRYIPAHSQETYASGVAENFPPSGGPPSDTLSIGYAIPGAGAGAVAGAGAENLSSTGSVEGVCERAKEPRRNGRGKSRNIVTRNGERRCGEPEEPDPFNDFWSVVHYKVGKGCARKAFAKAVDDVAAEKGIAKRDAASFLIETMAAFAKTPNANPTDRTPIHPTTWLNGGRFDDDPECWQERAARNGTTNGDAVKLRPPFDPKAERVYE